MFEEVLKNFDLIKIIPGVIAAILGTGIFIGVQKQNKQTQKSGNNSQNYQSNGDLYIDQANKNITIINQYGITKENAKEELMQIFKDNMPKLREMAKEIVNNRVAELNDALINKIAEQEQKIAEKIFSNLSEPDMQMSILEAQKSYAKSGNKDKLDILIDLLIKKGTEKQETTTQKILNIAISTVDKINITQIKILAFMCIFLCIKRGYSETFEDYLMNLQNQINIFNDIKSINKHDLIFLEQIGCIRMMETVQQHDIYTLLYQNDNIENRFNMSLDNFTNLIKNRIARIIELNKLWISNNNLNLVYSARTGIANFDLTLTGRVIAATLPEIKNILGKLEISFD